MSSGQMLLLCPFVLSPLVARAGCRIFGALFAGRTFEKWLVAVGGALSAGGFPLFVTMLLVLSRGPHFRGILETLMLSWHILACAPLFAGAALMGVLYSYHQVDSDAESAGRCALIATLIMSMTTLASCSLKFSRPEFLQQLIHF